MNRVLVISVLAAAWGLLLAGCDSNAARLTSSLRTDQGLTLVLPGIEGKGYLNRGIRNGLADGGVPTAIKIHDWTLGPVLAMFSQMWESRARSKADELAALIAAYQDAHPGRPMFLVAHSGGCAVAIFAAEALPKGHTIDGMMLLAPSVSPDYDLTSALRHVSGQVLSYFSTKDRTLLQVGMWVFGSMDGKHTSAAGRVGFSLPRTATDETLEQYHKLKQVPWDPSMRLSGNDGGHTDWADSRFVRDYVAPQVKRQMVLAQARLAPPAQTQPAAAPPIPIGTVTPVVVRPATQPARTPANTPVVRRPTTTQPATAVRRLPTTQPTTQPDRMIPPRPTRTRTTNS